MLTDVERGLVRKVWTTGPGPLLEVGYSPEAAREFLARTEVVNELALLDGEYQHHKAIAGRTAFIARRNLSRLVDASTAVLANALAGPRYQRGPSGYIVTDAYGHPVMEAAGVHLTQVRAAETILDAVGVADRKVEFQGDLQINVLLEATDAPVVEQDPLHESEEQRALSRERVRNVIERLSARLPDIKARARDMVGSSPSKPTARKKAAKKRSVPKKAG